MQRDQAHAALVYTQKHADKRLAFGPRALAVSQRPGAIPLGTLGTSRHLEVGNSLRNVCDCHRSLYLSKVRIYIGTS